MWWFLTAWLLLDHHEKHDKKAPLAKPVIVCPQGLTCACQPADSCVVMTSTPAK